MDDVLQKIRDYADAAHGSQMRKYTPERYIVHPVRVMELCRQYDDRLPVLAAALLHDVLEDTPVTKEEMLAFLKKVMTDADAQKTLELVVDLTDVYVKPDYPQWNRRVRKDRETERIAQTGPDSQTIKYADIIDNCSEITANDPGFAPRFLKECRANLRVADKGNRELYERALNMVNSKLAGLGGRR